MRKIAVLITAGVFALAYTGAALATPTGPEGPGNCTFDKGVTTCSVRRSTGGHGHQYVCSRCAHRVYDDYHDVHDDDDVHVASWDIQQPGRGSHCAAADEHNLDV